MIAKWPIGAAALLAAGVIAWAVVRHDPAADAALAAHEAEARRIEALHAEARGLLNKSIAETVADARRQEEGERQTLLDEQTAVEAQRYRDQETRRAHDAEDLAQRRCEGAVTEKYPYLVIVRRESWGSAMEGGSAGLYSMRLADSFRAAPVGLVRCQIDMTPTGPGSPRVEKVPL